LVKTVFENTTLDENKLISGWVKPIYSRTGQNCVPILSKLFWVFHLNKKRVFSRE